MIYLLQNENWSSSLETHLFFPRVTLRFRRRQLGENKKRSWWWSQVNHQRTVLFPVVPVENHLKGWITPCPFSLSYIASETKFIPKFHSFIMTCLSFFIYQSFIWCPMFPSLPKSWATLATLNLLYIVWFIVIHGCFNNFSKSRTWNAQEAAVSPELAI